MSLPTARISSHNHEVVGLFPKASNHIALSDGIPSEVYFEFEFPRDEMNIHFNVNPSVKKMTASCYSDGNRNVFAGKCVIARKSNIEPAMYQSTRRELSLQSSEESGANNPASNDNSVCIDLSCQPVLSRSHQNSRSGSRNSLSASNSKDNTRKQVSNVSTALSYDLGLASGLISKRAKQPADKLRSEPSADSVLSVLHTTNTTGMLEMNIRSIATARWVEDSPEMTDTVMLSQTASSGHSSLVAKTSECAEIRTPSRNKITRSISQLKPLGNLEYDSKEELADTAHIANFKAIDKPTDHECHEIGVSSFNLQERCEFDKKSTVRLSEKNSEQETEKLALNAERSINKTTSSRQAKLLLKVSSDQRKENGLSHLEKHLSEEMACMELDCSSNHRHESAMHATSDGVERIRSNHTDAQAQDEGRGMEGSEGSVWSERERETVAKIIMSRPLLFTKNRKTLANSGSFAATRSARTDETQMPKQFAKGKSWDKNQTPSSEIQSRKAQDQDAETSSSAASQTSISETYDIGSTTSCLPGAILPKRSEPAAEESKIRHSHHRKKKYSLYSETQSATLAPEVKNIVTGAAARTSPNSTDGDGTTIRRGPVDTGVRIGHTSINYFLSWDTDGFIPQEHMYNSTGVGVQERGQERTSSRRSIRLQKKYQTERKESEVLEDNNLDKESRSNADSIEICRGLVREKESVNQDHMSKINETPSNDFLVSYDNLSTSQSSFESNSPSSDLASRASISKSSTTILTLFSKNQSPKNISQSNVEINTDLNQRQNVTVLFENSLQTSLDNSCTGLISNPHLDVPTNVVCDKVEATPCADVCASDETHVIRRKRHRLTAKARQYLKKYDAASTTGSEECMSVDQLDVSNSSIVLRRKRNKSSTGLTFLQVRRTHPCRNLPRLMLKQDDKQLFCNRSDSSHSQMIKEVSVEDVKDYSESCCKQTTSITKLSNPKWVKSLDNMIDFVYIIPKITRLGNDEQIFFKKGAKLAKKQSKSTTELAVSDAERKAANVATLKSVGQESRCPSRSKTQTRTMTKSQAFRANRKRRYTIVKVDASVESESSHFNVPQQAMKNGSMDSTVRESLQQSKENCVTLKMPAGITRKERDCSNQRKATISRKGRLSAFLGCVTATTSENEQASNTNRSKTSSPCTKDTDKRASLGRKVVTNSGGKSGSVAEEKMCARKSRDVVESRHVEIDCASTKAVTDKKRVKKVVETETNSLQGCSRSRHDAVPEETGTSNNTEFVAAKKEVDKKKKIKLVVIGGGNTNEAKDGRMKTDRNTKKTARLIEAGNSTLNDCVEKVSFVDACASIRAKKGTNVDLSDEGWVTDENLSTISEHEATRSEQPVAENSKQIESVIQNVNLESIEQVNSIKSIRSPLASFFLSKKATKKEVTVAASATACEGETRPSGATTKAEDAVPTKMATARQRAAEYDKKNQLRFKMKREGKTIEN